MRKTAEDELGQINFKALMAQRSIEIFITPEELATAIETSMGDIQYRLIIKRRARKSNTQISIQDALSNESISTMYLGTRPISDAELPQRSPFYNNYVVIDHPSNNLPFLTMVQISYIIHLDESDVTNDPSYQHGKALFLQLKRYLYKRSKIGLELPRYGRMDKRVRYTEGARMLAKNGVLFCHMGPQESHRIPDRPLDRAYSYKPSVTNRN